MMMWTDVQDVEHDYYVAFRGVVEVNETTTVTIRTLASGWFTAWRDGVHLTEGPARFKPEYPEYDAIETVLLPGRTVFAIQAHHIGITTRILQDMAPFLYFEVFDEEGHALPLKWRCIRLPGYASGIRRINPQLGWIEYCDTRANPVDWINPSFDDQEWDPPIAAGPDRSSLGPTGLAPVQQFVLGLQPMASGELAEGFGYELDDIPARFFLRNLAPTDVPPQGVWRRYDLGRVRLGRPRFVLDVPEGAVIQFAYCEAMQHGRVSPYITLSAGPSCNLDHYVARGGQQVFEPITPKGGRYMEVHILADPASVHFVEESYLERGYYGPAEGAFTCDDPLLNRIWMTGVETYRACAEDAIIDNPTRERGQWTGDVVGVGVDIGSAAYGDIRLIRRALIQSGLCANEQGMVSGMSPGGDIFVNTYAVQWFTACLHYYELTGDRTLLEDAYPHAVRNLGAFEAHMTSEGLPDGLGWTFVDWGYARNEGPVDIALNLHFLAGIRSMITWCDILEKQADRKRCEAIANTLERVIGGWFDATLAHDDGWEQIGYHAAVLGLANGFLDGDRAAPCITRIKRHMLNCFPNNPDGPRNSDPAVQSHQIITPYFAHYAFPPLIERGEMDFVLDQFRTCWGYGLQEGRTTWIEVFDPRWSHCHQWAGCPTWQLSRYGLGLHPRFDLGDRHFVFRLIPGRLTRASGRVPVLNSEHFVDIEWEHGADGIRYRLKTPVPIWLHGVPGTSSDMTAIQDVFETVFPREAL